ncbi:peptidoglycan DD-metalloendopeptidase family protein [Nocardia sp. NPDC049149]|uniref:peptidoglycan DD-metalloendopeptidase family protein n=1 Tax=Nocardia sp. NPDC049149 TaxID=3364315 RepID=UPI003720185B
MTRYWPMKSGLLLTSGFGPRDGGMHYGQDIGWPGGSAGLPVYAMQAGTVDRVGPASGFGQWICLDHPTAAGGGYTVYGHIIPEVRLGLKVEAGQRIARINPDTSTNGGVTPHLHVEVHRSTWAEPGPDRLDPRVWLATAIYPGQPTRGGKPMDLMPYREQLHGLWNNADNTAQVIVQHTTESESGNSNVINYLEKTGNGSYQTMVDSDGEEVRMVPDDRQAWGAGSAGNRIGLHVCAMGRAAFSRERWLSETRLLERTAMRYAEWSRAYGIPLVKLGPAEVRAGERGICGHADISAAFREVDHTDPGVNFPYDVVIERAKQLLNQEDDMQLSDTITDAYGNKVSVGDVLKWVSYHADLTIDQLGGPGSRTKIPAVMPGWAQLGDKTFVDSLADAHKKIDRVIALLEANGKAQ